MNILNLLQGKNDVLDKALSFPEIKNTNLNKNNSINSFENMIKNKIEKDFLSSDANNSSINSLAYNSSKETPKSSDFKNRDFEENLGNNKENNSKEENNIKNQDENKTEAKLNNEKIKNDVKKDLNEKKEVKNKNGNETLSNQVMEIKLEIKNLLADLKVLPENKKEIVKLKQEAKDLISKFLNKKNPETKDLNNLKNQLQQLNDKFKKLFNSANNRLLSKNKTIKIPEEIIHKINKLVKKISQDNNAKQEVATQLNIKNKTNIEKNNAAQVLSSENRNTESNINLSSKNNSNFNEKNDDSFNFVKNTHNNRNINNPNQANSQNKNTLFDKQLGEILDKAKIVVKNSNNSHMILRLNPQHLGKVNINLGLENGVLHGKFLVESQEAKDALHSSLSLLKETLEAEGFSLGEFNVDVKDQHQEFNYDEEKLSLNSVKPGIKMNEIISKEYERNSDYHAGSINMVI